MLKHADIWDALDRLARDRGLTPSGLARRAGLDPTTFNKSKRITREGKPRWPSTESISKVLEATGSTLRDFVAFLTPEPEVDESRALPLLNTTQARAADRLSNGALLSNGEHDEISFLIDAADAVAIEVAGEVLTPCYREGDVIIVSPTAEVRRGDRVLLRTAVGELMAAEVVRRTSRRVTLMTDHQFELPADQVTWIARILWASQ